MVGAFVALLFMALIPAFIASGKGRSFALWYFYGLFLFLFAFIHALIIKPNEKAEGMKKCPKCASIIPDIAIICPSCRTNFSLASDVPQAQQSDVVPKSAPQKDFEGDLNIALAPYQLYLTRRFAIEKNDTLGKFVIGDDVFDNLEQSLAEADRRYRAKIAADREVLRVDEQNRIAAKQKRLALAEKQAREAEAERQRLAEEDARLAPIRAAKLRRMNIGFGVVFAVVITGLAVVAIKQNQEREIRKEIEHREKAEAEEKARVAALEAKANLDKQNSEITTMFSSGIFFGFKLGENNLEQLSQKSGKTLRTEYFWGDSVKCDKGECEQITGSSSLASRLTSVSFVYCVPDKFVGKGNKYYQLQEVRMFFGSFDGNWAVEKFVEDAKALPDKPVDVVQDFGTNDRGLGLKWKKSGDRVVDLCGNRSGFWGERVR